MNEVFISSRELIEAPVHDQGIGKTIRRMSERAGHFRHDAKPQAQPQRNGMGIAFHDEVELHSKEAKLLRLY